MLLSADMKLNCLFSILFFISFSGIAAAGDEVLINQQLQQGGVIHLQAGIYNIEGPIKIHSNTVLTGEPDTILRVSSSAGQWFVDDGIIDNADTSLHDVEISGFQIDGNLKQLPQSYANSGSGDHNAERLIDLRGGSANFMSNISIHDMKLYDAYSDAIHIAFANNVNVYNNFVSDCQHSGIYFVSVVNGLMDSNKVAGITSDCLRFDNCVNNIFRNNTLYSYTGNSNGAYQNGQNGVQIADKGFSHGGGSNKPTSTKNIEGYGNIFSSGGLRDIWIDSTGKGVENVYVHDNKGTTVITSGTPVTGIDFANVTGIDLANISFSNPPTKEMSETIFNYIFDALNLKYADSGFTNQTAEEIQYSVKQTEQGAIAGGITIIGFSNVVTIDGVNYIPDNNSILVKYAAVKAPSFTFVTGGASNIKSNVNTSIVNGTAYATLTVKMEYYTVSTNSNSQKSIKNYHVSTATFNDSCKSPDVLDRPQNITGTIYQYPTFFMVSVPSHGLTKILYEYAGNSTEHIFLVGSRNYTSNNIESTDFSRLEHWTGNLQHSGAWLYVLGEFDQSKLSVTASTPYESQTVSDFNITKFNYPKTIIANWFYPELAFLAISFFFGKWLFNQMKYR
jgi:hypothetical protein